MQVLVFGSRFRKLFSADEAASFYGYFKKRMPLFIAHADYFCTFARINAKLKYKNFIWEAFSEQ